MSESDKNIVLQLINEIELLEFDENILLIDGAIKNNNLVLLKEFSKDRNGYITDSLKIKEVHKNLFYCQEMATTNRIGGDDWERFYENYVLIINNTILKCKVANQYLKKEDKINCTEELLKFHYILSYKKAYEEIFNYYNIDKKSVYFNDIELIDLYYTLRYDIQIDLNSINFNIFLKISILNMLYKIILYEVKNSYQKAKSTYKTSGLIYKDDLSYLELARYVPNISIESLSNYKEAIDGLDYYFFIDKNNKEAMTCIFKFKEIFSEAVLFNISFKCLYELINKCEIILKKQFIDDFKNHI